MADVENLDVATVIDRALQFCPSDVEPLLEYLEMGEVASIGGSSKSKAGMIVKRLRAMGSNDLATFFRGGEGVGYEEVVYDVGRKLKAGVTVEATLAANEHEILKTVFANALDQMSESEKRELMRSMEVSGGDFPTGAAGVLLTQILLNKLGGFAVYRMSVVVANLVSRALLNRGLSLAANAALTRTVGVFLGPVGWIVTGAWLLVDLAGPAFRKTVPAVIHIAMLREMVRNRVTIGVVGDGATGKDALIRSVFGLDTGGVDPVAGSTSETQVYQLGDSGAVYLVNYPGFNDVRPQVNKFTADFLDHTDAFLMVADISRGISGTDAAILRRVQAYGRPVLVCLNKVDLPREGDKGKLLAAARERLKGAKMVETAFDPDKRLGQASPSGVTRVHRWVCEQVAREGKQTVHIPRSEYVSAQAVLPLTSGR